MIIFFIKALFIYSIDISYSTPANLYQFNIATFYLFLISRNLPYLIPCFWICYICHPMSLFHWSFTFNCKAKLFEGNNLPTNPT